jgi:hypothetical protein
VIFTSYSRTTVNLNETGGKLRPAGDWKILNFIKLTQHYKIQMRGFRFPLLFNVETLQAFGALSQIPHYYRKFLYCKPKMLCNNLNKLKFSIKTMH